MADPVVTREEAVSRGLKKYFTGKPCLKGHVSERYCSSNACVECLYAHTRKYRKEKPEIYSKYWKKWYENNIEYNRQRNAKYREDNLERCKEVCRASAKRHREANREKCDDQVKRWVADNPDRVKANKAKWNRANADYWRAKNAERRSKMKNATPPWADVEAIRQIYRQACALACYTGIDFDVDHIIPLTSDVVCGLHCEDNLRIVPARINRMKSNKFEVSNG